MNKIDLVMIGNILGALALAFLIDNIALSGAVTQTLPDEIVSLVAFLIFAGAAVYAYKQLKRLN